MLRVSRNSLIASGQSPLFTDIEPDQKFPESTPSAASVRRPKGASRSSLSVTDGSLPLVFPGENPSTSKEAVRGSAGGIAVGLIRRQRAIAAYYANPNRCQHCDKIIEIPPNAKPAEVRSKKFCNTKCANRRARPWLDGKVGPPRKKPRDCIRCGKKCPGDRSKFCSDKCRGMAAIEGLGRRTKGELFSSRKNWQAARSAIRQHAERVFELYELPKNCAKCGYSVHTEIAHAKAVSKFPPSATIREINDPGNLVALCRNHHWEFDNGVLALSTADK